MKISGLFDARVEWEGANLREAQVQLDDRRDDDDLPPLGEPLEHMTLLHHEVYPGLGADRRAATVLDWPDFVERNDEIEWAADKAFYEWLEARSLYYEAITDFRRSQGCQSSWYVTRRVRLLAKLTFWDIQ